MNAGNEPPRRRLPVVAGFTMTRKEWSEILSAWVGMLLCGAIAFGIVQAGFEMIGIGGLGPIALIEELFGVGSGS